MAGKTSVSRVIKLSRTTIVWNNCIGIAPRGAMSPLIRTTVEINWETVRNVDHFMSKLDLVKNINNK